MSELIEEFCIKNAKNNFTKELLDLRNEYRQDGVPTMLVDGLNELILFSKMVKAKNILELGTATGCSAIALLKANENAKITTVEKFENLQLEAIQNFKNFGVYDRVNSILGEAVEVVESLNEQYDFIFLDCNKSAYKKLYPKLKELLKSGGVLVADNVLFRGYVENFEECPKKYKSLVNNLRIYIEMAMSDSDMVSTLLQTGDGLLVSLKK